MSAKEMFKKLGYNVKFENNNFIHYANLELLKELEFDKEYKVFYIIGSKTIFGDELQAINKQVEELGWNER